MFKPLTTLGLILSISILATSFAQAHPQNMCKGNRMSAEERIENRLDTLQNRLNLTQQQADQIRAIMETGRDEHLDIAARYGVDMKDRESRRQLDREKKQQMRDEMQQLRNNHRSKIEAVLNESQVAEWKIIQDERRVNRKQKWHGKKHQEASNDSAKPN